MKGLKAGDFCITFGAEGFLVGLGTAGFAPCFSVTKAVCQVRRHGRQILEESEQSKSACLKWRPSTLEDANALLLYIHEESPPRYCPTTMCHVPRLFSARCSDRFAQSPQGRNRGRRCSLARPRLASLLHSSILMQSRHPVRLLSAPTHVCAEQQVLAASVLRAATFYYNWRFYGMAAAEKQRKDKSSAAAGTRK